MPPPAGKETKISLNLSQFVPPSKPKTVSKSTPSKMTPPPVLPKVKPLIKPVEKVVKPIVNIKRKLLDEHTRVFVEKVSKEDNNVSKKKPKQKKIVKKKVKKKKIKKRIVKRKAQRKRSNNPLANALANSGTSMYPKRRKNRSSGAYTAKMIHKLYGREFNTYSPTQKKFIRKNLGLIHRITQRTLTRNGYPETAARTQQQGTNVVAFYLHPNGDISRLRLKKRLGYASLDQNTLQVIRIAYKNYPRPSKKTKIIFYVQYSIY